MNPFTSGSLIGIVIAWFMAGNCSAQTKICVEHHTFAVEQRYESHSYFGKVFIDDGTATFEMHLKDIVYFNVIDGEKSKRYHITQDGIYDISLPIRSKKILIIFTDSQGTMFYWYL